MKILLTNHMLQGVAGTQKWTYTMARELVTKGHAVDVFAFLHGETSDKLRPFCRVTDRIEPGYDVVMSNHNTCFAVARSIGCPIIHTSHGPKHGLERPPPDADALIGVSEEVKNAYGLPMEVVPNGVDLEEYRPVGSPMRDKPVVLSMCKSISTTWMLQDACRELGWHFSWLHYNIRAAWDTASMIQAADVVVGCGRTAAEALACGKSVLVFDGRSDEPRADGWITEDNVDTLARKNFSCRTNALYWGLPALTDALSAYQPSPWARAWAELHRDIRKTAGRYVEIAESLLERPAHDPDLTAEYEMVEA